MEVYRNTWSRSSRPELWPIRWTKQVVQSAADITAQSETEWVIAMAVFSLSDDLGRLETFSRMHQTGNSLWLSTMRNRFCMGKFYIALATLSRSSEKQHTYTRRHAGKRHVPPPPHTHTYTRTHTHKHTHAGGGGERDTHRHRQRETQTETQRHRHRHRQRETETQREREIPIPSQTIYSQGELVLRTQLIRRILFGNNQGQCLYIVHHFLRQFSSNHQTYSGGEVTVT